MAETTSRILTLLTLLQSHRQWSGPELAARLEVTERTLRRDMERLRELGYRIETTRGAAGGYRLEAGAELPPLLLTEEEAVTMAIGLRLAATRGISGGADTTLSALAKFEQVLPSALRERVNALANIDLPPGIENDVPSGLLGQLALAARDGERIRFHYLSADGSDSDRVVEPHSLVAAERNWYLVAWDIRRTDWRTFRVDRISRFFGTRLRFESRELPTRTAADFVASARSGSDLFEIEVVIQLPLQAAKERFGRWADTAEAVDATTTRWPIRVARAESALFALTWIADGTPYEVTGTPASVEYIRRSAERILAATASIADSGQKMT